MATYRISSINRLLNKMLNRKASKTQGAVSAQSKAVLVLVLAIGALFTASAQEETTAQAPEEAPQEQEVERIIVEGQNYDSAMKAFNSGNFELAEIEFKKNAMCALRIERNRDAFVDGLQSSAIDSSVQNSASLQGGGANAEGSDFAAAPTTPIGRGGTANNRDDDSSSRERTCENRGFQLYMAALSQIQLGNAEEAEKNFKTATFLNTHIYDAQYRLALINLLRGDTDEAQDRFSKLERTLKRCKDCAAKDDIIARIDFLQKALSGEIKLN